MARKEIVPGTYGDTEKGTVETYSGGGSVVSDMRDQESFDHLDGHLKGNENWENFKADLPPSVARIRKD